MLTKVKTESEIAAMRESGRMLATVLGHISPQVAVGISTKELADSARKELLKLVGQPAFLGYYGFPDVLCVSINDEVVHGIPKSHRQVKEGDIVSLDFGVSYNGMITDGALSVIAGKASGEVTNLVTTTSRALMAGISVVRSGIHVGDIAAVVQ